MNSMVVFLIPLLGLVIWLGFFTRSESEQPKPKPQWLTLKLREIDISNGYEFVQCLYDFGFKYDANHQIFNFIENDQLWFRCLNLRKPGKFDNLEDGKTIHGLMFVTDIAAINTEDKKACLNEMMKLVCLCKEQYGGQIYDANGPVDTDTWLNDTMVTNNGANVVQKDMLSA